MTKDLSRQLCKGYKLLNKIIIEDNYAKLIIKSKKYGVKEVFIDIENIELTKKYIWSLRKDKNNFYAISNDYSSGKKQTIILHRFILNPNQNEIIDHINKNGLDNRKLNIRISNKSENRINSRLNKNNTSGYCGVYLNKNSKKYQARYKINGKEKSLGYFDNAEQAYKVRCDYIDELKQALQAEKNWRY